MTEILKCYHCNELIEGEPFHDGSFNEYCSDDCRYPYTDEEQQSGVREVSE